MMTYKSLDANEIRAKVLPVLHKYNVKKAALFGSSVRGEMKRGSDIDLIIDIGELSSGLIFVEIKRKMEQRLNRKVDLISYNSLAYSNLEEKILSETQIIYEETN
jgi:uncharacterized protein